MAKMKAKTHQERAEAALARLYKFGWVGITTPYPDGPVQEVARETWPAELVQAAKELLELRFVNRPKRTELRIERRMKAVLDLYEKEAP